MRPEEDVAHFSMWAMIAAPLIAGNDLGNMTAATLATLTNAEVIAVNQDVGGKPARRVVQAGGWSGYDVWSRQLANGDYAVALLNRNADNATDITLEWSAIGLPPEQPAALRDLWRHADLGRFTANYTAAAVPPHSVVMLRATQVAVTAPWSREEL